MTNENKLKKQNQWLILRYSLRFIGKQQGAQRRSREGSDRSNLENVKPARHVIIVTQLLILYSEVFQFQVKSMDKYFLKPNIFQ